MSPTGTQRRRRVLERRTSLGSTSSIRLGPYPRDQGPMSRVSVEPAVEVVVVGAEIEQPVPRVGEQDHPFSPLLLGEQRLIDDGPDGMAGLRGRDRPLGAGVLHRGL